MEKDKYEFAKELLKQNYYSISHFNEEEKKEWDSYNVPEELVIEWIKEYLNTLLKEIYVILNENSIIEEKQIKTVLLNLSIILQDTYNYRVIWFEEILQVIKVIDERITLGRAFTVTNMWDRLYLNISLFLSNKDKERRYLDFNRCYYYDTDEKYFGLLPYLYKMKEYKLFNELFDMLYKYIEDYKELKSFKFFDVYSVFIEYAKYMNMDYEKYLK